MRRIPRIPRSVDGRDGSGTKETKESVGGENVRAQEFPSDECILTQLLDYCEKKNAYPHQIKGGMRNFGLRFGLRVDRVEVANRTLELELEYLKMAGKSESSLVHPEDRKKFRLFKSIWQGKHGDIDQIADDIEFLKNIFKRGAIPSGKNVEKRMKKLKKKYLGTLKIENGVGKYSMSPYHKEFLRLSSIIWHGNAAGSSQVSGQEPKSSDCQEEPLSHAKTKRTLDEVPDIEILKCMIAYYAENKTYPLNYTRLVSMCRDFLHIQISNMFFLGDRVANLLWKYMMSLYDQERFRWSRILWGDTLGVISDYDSTGDEKDDTDKNKNDKKDESPKSPPRWKSVPSIDSA